MANQNEQKQGKTATIIITFIIGLFIGGGSVWVWLSNDSGSTQVLQNGDTEEQTDNSAIGSENHSPITETSSSHTSREVVVADQEAGGEVKLQSVSFDQAGWVVIHELISDGSLGNALGAQRFDAGTSSGEVNLLRVTEAGSTYAAVLYRDNGDRRFDLDLDLPIRDSSQNIVYTTFSIIK